VNVLLLEDVKSRTGIVVPYFPSESRHFVRCLAGFNPALYVQHRDDTVGLHSDATGSVSSHSYSVAARNSIVYRQIN
jgi:hypothetical protein